MQKIRLLLMHLMAWYAPAEDGCHLCPGYTPVRDAIVLKQYKARINRLTFSFYTGYIDRSLKN